MVFLTIMDDSMGRRVGPEFVLDDAPGGALIRNGYMTSRPTSYPLDEKKASLT